MNNRADFWRQRFMDLSENEKRHLKANYSIPLDKKGFRNVGLGLQATTKKIFRLGHQLNIVGGRLSYFATYFEKFKFYRANPANYDISGSPFSSLRDGSLGAAADPRIAKVKRFIGNYRNGRETTDKDVDYLIYTFFGSDDLNGEYSYRTGDLFYGIQDDFYTPSGMRKEKSTMMARNLLPGRVRNDQRRISYYSTSDETNRSRYTYHYGEFEQRRTSPPSGLMSNNYRNRRRNAVAYRRNRHRNATTYLRNKPAVKRNQNRNKSNKRIQWQVNTVSNMPRDIISYENISNGEKVVKYSWKKGGQTHSRYLQPQSFRNYARMSMTDTFNKNASFSLFENPETRAIVKRSNINFVILKKKVVNRRKTNAATKIQKVVRGTQARNKIRKNAQNALKKLTVVQKSVLKKQATAKKASATARRTLLASAASKRKQSPK